MEFQDSVIASERASNKQNAGARVKQYILGLYWDNGKENGNDYDGLYIGVI